MTAHPIRAIGVGVPARDEEDTIATCLAAIAEAAREVAVPVVVVVVADGCTDDTAARASASLGPAGTVLATARRGVGRARALALDTAATAAALPAEEVWLATTDADTTVSPSWLATQLRWAAAGFDAVAGLVGVDWADGTARLPDRYLASLAPDGTGMGHGHVHGANLGVRASWWRAVDGCGAAACGEDRELWERLTRAGARTIGVDDLAVTTSGRLQSRVEGGFATYLAALA